MAYEQMTAPGGRIRGAWWKALTGVWMGLTIVLGICFVGPAAGFTMGGEGAKLVFFHVPCPWVASGAYIAAAIYAIRYLYRGSRLGWIAAAEDDLKVHACMELGLLFSVLATVTGMIFSNNEWHAYWSWDPRQTSILVLLLIYAAYLVLRGAIDDVEQRGKISAAYALIAAVPGFFLIWAVPIIMKTLHPELIVVRGQIAGSYRPVLYGFAVPSLIAVFVWMFQLRLRSLKLLNRTVSPSL